jgi:hypothetical protein
MTCPLRTWVEAAESLARAKLDHTRCSRACAKDDGLLWIIQAKSVSSDDAIRRLITRRTDQVALVCSGQDPRTRMGKAKGAQAEIKGETAGYGPTGSNITDCLIDQ